MCEKLAAVAGKRKELQQTINSYTQAEAFLLGLVRAEPRPYASHALQGIRLLLTALGNPHLGQRYIHIAGSKGKGSVALMSEALFEAHGVHTATFTSPHLRRWNERFRIGAEDISDSLLIDTLERIRPIVLRVASEAPDEVPSFFDVLCAAALLLFREAEVDLAIIECGLGGRHDASNVITPEISCITSIEYEHQDKLGNDLADIASHKAGIIKSHTPIVCGPLPAPARLVVLQEAQRLHAPLYRFGEDFNIEGLSVTTPDEPELQRLRYTAEAAPDVEFSLNCYGRHMAENSALALTLLHCLNSRQPLAGPAGFDSAFIAACFSVLLLPGRGQVLSRDPTIIVDSAHTPVSIQLLGQHLGTLGTGARSFLISATWGKDLQALGRLLESAKRVYVTCADPLRSMPAVDLATGLALHDQQLKVEVIEDPQNALASARDNLSGNQILCICGSAYLAGFALDHLQQ